MSSALRHRRLWAREGPEVAFSATGTKAASSHGAPRSRRELIPLLTLLLHSPPPPRCLTRLPPLPFVSHTRLDYAGLSQGTAQTSSIQPPAPAHDADISARVATPAVNNGKQQERAVPTQGH